MAPTGEPLTEIILQDIQDAFEAIQGGDDYYTTVPVANIHRAEIGEVEVVAFPAIVLVPGTIEYDTEPRETRVLRTITGRWTIHVTLLLQTRTDAVRKVERFIRDVHKAWNVDRRRGNYALDSKLRLSTPYYPSDPDDDVCGAYMEFEVWFRSALDDLNSVP